MVVRLTMAEFISDDEVINAVAQLLGKERRHGREEIEKLRWQLANAEDYAKVLAGGSEMKAHCHPTVKMKQTQQASGAA